MEPKPPSYESTLAQPSYPPPEDYPPHQGAYPPPPQGAYPPPPLQGAYPPPPQGAYPPPPPQDTYPPPSQVAYPPPQAAYLPPQTGQNQSYVYPGPDAGNSSNVDVEYGRAKHSDEYHGVINFNDKSVRMGFIRKVFAILILQMSVTIIMMCWFIFHEPTRLYVQKNWGMYVAGYVTFLVLYFVLVCCTSVARKYPTNLILLAIFTISLAYMVAVISSFHDTKIVLALFGMTLLISAGIIGFASQTKYDFTKWGGVLFVACFTLFIFGLFAAILVPNGWMRGLNILYSGLGALLFMAFLAYDTQLIMGGKKYEISPEDYVFAAMMLYVDIIYIFLFLLSLFGGSN